MFTKSSDIYDLLYSSKNYQRESEVLIEKIKNENRVKRLRTNREI